MKRVCFHMKSDHTGGNDINSAPLVDLLTQSPKWFKYFEYPDAIVYS